MPVNNKKNRTPQELMEVYFGRTFGNNNDGILDYKYAMMMWINYQGAKAFFEKVYLKCDFSEKEFNDLKQCIGKSNKFYRTKFKDFEKDIILQKIIM